MKRVLLTITAFCAAVSLNAQVVNGNLETWASGEPSNWLYDFGGSVGVQPGTENWLTDFGEVATTTQTPGMLSGTGALLETVDATSATLIDAGVTQIGGLLLGEWSYSGPDLESVSFDYDARPLAGDTSFVEVALFNFAGELISIAGAFWFPADATSDWTSITIPFVDAGGAGSVNSIRIYCLSSYSTGAGTPETGSTLKVDNFVLNEASTSSVIALSNIELSAFPNPATDVLNIKTTADATSVSIISMDGKVVSTQEMNGTSATVNVSELKAGVYFYEVEALDGTVVRHKFLKN